MSKTDLLLLLGAAVSCHGLLMSQKASHEEEHFQQCLASYAEGLDDIRDGLGRSIRDFMKLDPSSWHTSEKKVVVDVGPGTTATRLFRDVMLDLGLQGWHFGSNNYSLHLQDVLGECYPDGMVECKSHAQPTNEHMPAERQAACYNDLRTFDYATLPETIMFLADVPFPELFVHFYRAFPNARFVLTERPSDEWAERRLQDHHYSMAIMQEPCGIYVRDFSLQENAKMLDLHNELVRCSVDETRLFEFDIFAHPESIEALPQKLATFLGLEGDFAGKH